MFLSFLFALLNTSEPSSYLLIKAVFVLDGTFPTLGNSVIIILLFAPTSGGYMLRLPADIPAEGYIPTAR